MLCLIIIIIIIKWYSKKVFSHIFNINLFSMLEGGGGGGGTDMGDTLCYLHILT